MYYKLAWYEAGVSTGDPHKDGSPVVRHIMDKQSVLAALDDGLSVDRGKICLNSIG
jgi:hypothetical protein